MTEHKQNDIITFASTIKAAGGGALHCWGLCPALLPMGPGCLIRAPPPLPGSPALIAALRGLVPADLPVGIRSSGHPKQTILIQPRQLVDTDPVLGPASVEGPFRLAKEILQEDDEAVKARLLRPLPPFRPPSDQACRLCLILSWISCMATIPA